VVLIIFYPENRTGERKRRGITEHTEIQAKKIDTKSEQMT
jgi:hypothetical protein